MLCSLLRTFKAFFVGNAMFSSRALVHLDSNRSMVAITYHLEHDLLHIDNTVTIIQDYRYQVCFEKHIHTVNDQYVFLSPELKEKLKKLDVIVNIPPTASVTPTVAPTVHVTVTPSAVKPKVDPTVKPKVDPTVKPKVDTTVKPKVDTTVKPKVDPTVKPKVDPTVKPKVDPTELVTITTGKNVELPNKTPLPNMNHPISDMLSPKKNENSSAPHSFNPPSTPLTPTSSRPTQSVLNETSRRPIQRVFEKPIISPTIVVFKRTRNTDVGHHQSSWHAVIDNHDRILDVESDSESDEE